MANLVEIVINGRDNTNAAFNRVLGNTKQLSKEMRSFGTVISNVGNASAALGNTAFSGLANKTAGLIMTGEALALTFRKVNLTLKSTVIGLALAGAAYGVAKVMEYRDAVEAAAEATKKLNDFITDSNVASMWDEDLKKMAELSVAHEKRLDQIEELAIARVDPSLINKAVDAEEIRSSNDLLKVKLASSQKAIDKAEQEKKAKLQSTLAFTQGSANMFGDLANASATFGKKAFGLTKALRIGEAIMNTATAVTNALAAPVPWPIPLVFAAAAAAAGAVQIGVIAASKPGGQAHGGLEYVPEESTFLLQRGERVIQPRQNAQLQDMLDRGGSGGGGATQVTIIMDGRTLFKAIGQASADGRLTINARAIA